MNNSEEDQETTVYNGEGKSTKLTLKPLEMIWFTKNEIDQLCK